MLRKNVFNAQKESVVAHNGKGQIQFVRLFESLDFETELSFVDYVELLPDTSIGIHKHGHDEEIYFILEGSGAMIVNGEQFAVESGDLIVNRQGWSHGLYNNSSDILKVLVWEVAGTP